jgi:hypothetical protein
MLKQLEYNKPRLYLLVLLPVFLFLACRVAKNETPKWYKYFIVFERKRITNENTYVVNTGINYYIITDPEMSLQSLAKNLAGMYQVDKSNVFSVIDKGDYKSLMNCKFPYTISYNETFGSVLYQIFYIGHENPIFRHFEYPYESTETEILIGQVKSKYRIVPIKDNFLDCIKRNKILLSNTEDNYKSRVNDTLSFKFSINNFNPAWGSVFLNPNSFFNGIDTIFTIR